jgi:branched-chain amino acid transport system substrate-binding protein
VFRDGAQLWAKWENGKGGVAGHPVQVIVADDGGDPARHRVQVRDLVENQGVLAFVSNVAVFTDNATTEYYTAKRIPVIGMTGMEAWAYTSPMYFPQQSSGPYFLESMFASWAQQGLEKGKRRLGILACAESELCRLGYERAAELSEKYGLELVYKGRISIAQPDFTAECLTARNAGVEILAVGADVNSLRRVAASCSRQGYRPLFATGGPVLVDDLKSDSNFDNNLVANALTFPYFSEAGPVAEFRTAMRQYGSGMEPSIGAASAWVAGKLFARAAARITDTPSSESILAGLWSLQNDDLGGITAPLTFSEGLPASPTLCWWNIAIVDGHWTSPDGFKRTCR